MEIVEDQQHRLEEARLNLATPLTSETENCGEARPKTTSGDKLTSIVPNTLFQEAAVKDHATLLRDEIFSAIPGTVNMQHGTVYQNRKIKSGRDSSEDEVFESDHLPEVPDMPITGGGHGHIVTFRSPDVRPR